MAPPSSAVLFANVQLIKVGEEELLRMAPAYLLAEFLENKQLVKVGEEELLYMPPPFPKRLPGFEKALLPVSTQLRSIGEDEELYMPPPAPPISSLPDVLSLKTQFTRTGDEASSLFMPPPEPPKLEFLLKVQLNKVGEDKS